METGYSMRHWCRTLASLLEMFRQPLASALKHLRCGYRPNYATVHQTMKWMVRWADVLSVCAAIEIAEVNRRLPEEQRITPWTKPRWYRKKAPPKPSQISLADQETYLEGLLRWHDSMLAATENPAGECYPHMPHGLQAVLKRNGYDPQNPRSPAQLLKDYLV